MPPEGEPLIPPPPAAGAPDAADPTAGDDDGSVIDVAVFYTPAARQKEGGSAAIEALIDLMIAETNQAYADSGVIQRVRLVARDAVDYTEAATGEDDLYALTRRDGVMDGIHAIRDRDGADLVHLIVDRDRGGNYDVCGIAWVPIEVAIGRREAVAAVFERRPAEAPQGVLQPLGQGGETLPTQHDVCVGEAGIGQAEVVQKVFEPRAGNPHPQTAGIGEVRQPELTRRMGLAEHDLLRRTVHRAPLANATLQRPTNAGSEFRMAAHQLLKQRHRANARRVLQQRHDLLVEDPRQRIRPTSTPRLLPGGGQSRIGLDPVGRGGAEPGLRRSRLQRVPLSK